MSRVVLAMSGGVDSSVAAHLLLEQGHDVIGVFMRHGEQSPVVCAADEKNGLQLPVVNRPDHKRLDHKQGCCTAADAADARRVADKLGIPFYALNLDQEFGQIIDYFVAEYSAGRTPNPCVQCNNWIKFGKLFDYADSVDAQYVATGHYARLGLVSIPEPNALASGASVKTADFTSPEASAYGSRGGIALLRGVDTGKDQSYVLFGIDKERLPRMLLPVGGFEKSEIRQIAAKLDMRVADKQDSQEICFVTQGRYDEFVRAKRDTINTAGEMVTTDGTVVGEHAGIEGFTVGQRKGLGVALGEPKFVVRIEADSRRVVIGDREELCHRELTAKDTNWLVDIPAGEQRCLAQIRYNAPAARAVMERLENGRLSVKFDEPQFGIAPGQAVVCYDNDHVDSRVLGGGWIE